MPKLNEHTSASTVKMMFVGDSGTGKTGALLSLLKAGYKLKIIDFDNGLDVLAMMARQENKSELLENAQFMTFTDKWKAVGSRMIPQGQPKAWSNALKLISTGKLGEEDWGDPSGWGEDTVLVLDSLTMASQSAMLNVLQVNGRLMETPYQSDWGEAQRIVVGLINALCSTEFKCNVIVNTHINYIELEGLAKGYPSAIGKALSTQLPRYFNTILQAYSKGKGQSAKRYISGIPQGVVETKAAVPPKKLPENWPLETGLADFFKLFKGELKQAEKS